MAQIPVVQWTCDRCKAEELRPMTKESSLKDVPVVTIRFGEHDVSWTDLCDRCSHTVKNYVDLIFKLKKKGTDELSDPLSK